MSYLSLRWLLRNRVRRFVLGLTGWQRDDRTSSVLIVVFVFVAVVG